MKDKLRVDEVAEGIYRINAPVSEIPGGFSFNQYVVKGDGALLFHTGPRKMGPAVVSALRRIIDLKDLRYVGVSHVESDECGGLNEILAHAPQAVPVCSQICAMVQMNDLADRAPRAMADGEVLDLGPRQFTWVDAAHVPHGWDCGYFFENSTKTLLCGDLFTQPGTGDRPLVEEDILTPSEGFRAQMDYFAHAPHTKAVLDRLARFEPRTLACMHGSAYAGDGAAMLKSLSEVLS